jgi:hypothetical protein
MKQQSPRTFCMNQQGLGTLRYRINLTKGWPRTPDSAASISELASTLDQMRAACSSQQATEHVLELESRYCPLRIFSATWREVIRISNCAGVITLTSQDQRLINEACWAEVLHLERVKSSVWLDADAYSRSHAGRC